MSNYLISEIKEYDMDELLLLICDHTAYEEADFTSE